MKLKFYDYETYPDWWCCVVSDEDDNYPESEYAFNFTAEDEKRIKSNMRVYTSDGGTESYKALLTDLSTGVNTGYNSKRFDQVISKCISMHFTPRQVYIAAMIITESTHNIPKELNVTQTEIARIRPHVTGWRGRWQGAQANQDLMDDSNKGLKDKEAAFGMDIQETTVPFNKVHLTEQDKEDIIHYCKHDVYALHVQYVTISRPYIATKLNLGKTFDVSAPVCYGSTNAILAGRVLGAERVHGTTITDPTFKIYQDPIRKYIETWVPEEALNHLYTSQKPKQMTMFENRVYMADGGIHSIYTTPRVGRAQSKLYVEACEEYGIYNIDLSGCHPSVMLFVGAMPRGITRPDRFKETVMVRRDLKNIPKDQWTKEQHEYVNSGKLIHNTTYGAAGNQYLPLYDDYMRSKVCRVSQMVIIAVAMQVHTELGARVIQTNTDGILLYMKRDNLDKLKKIIEDFEELSEFVFDLEEDSRIWQLNVNNYIAIDTKGKPTLKGKSFITSIWQKGYNRVRPLGNHVIAKAQYEFYVNKANPVKFILDHDHVNDFILTCTKGPTYFGMVQKTRDGDIPLGKVTRVMATTVVKYGEVRKQKYVNGKLQEDLCANCPPHTWVMNDALSNYKITGDMANRRIEHISGMSAPIDMTYYARLLDRVLDLHWYKWYKGKLTYTREFNLGGD